MTEIVSPGDFDGDGKPDVIGRYSDGDLRLHIGNGAGGPLGGYTTLATKWSMTEILSARDFDGDAKADMIARYGDGELRLYRGDGSGKLITSTFGSLGTGRNDFGTIG